MSNNPNRCKKCSHLKQFCTCPPGSRPDDFEEISQKDAESLGIPTQEEDEMTDIAGMAMGVGLGVIASTLFDSGNTESSSIPDGGSSPSFDGFGGGESGGGGGGGEF